MRDDSDFIADLRREIENLRIQRAKMGAAKAMFVTTLLGVGAASQSGRIYSAALLYLAPIIAVMFDLHVIGDDFGIKRAGMFIRESPHAPPEERLWEQCLEHAPDRYAFLAEVLSSAMVFAFSAAALRYLPSVGPVNPYAYWAWFAINVVVLLLVARFRQTRKIGFGHFKEVVHATRAKLAGTGK